jgi:predicted ATPase
MPELRKLNLIYGFNGSGKTILSRVFASLEAGAVRAE